MKKIYSVLIALVVVIGMAGCNEVAPKPVKMAKVQSVQVISSDNGDGKITTKTIESAFNETGLKVGANNDMNNPFSQRFPSLHYKVYNLAVFSNNELAFKLIKKYPDFGSLMPLTMSIWSDNGTMNIATLTLDGLSRAGEIPASDPDLIAYSKMIDEALKSAMPNGKFKDLPFSVKEPKKSYAIKFEMNLEENIEDIEEFKEDFQTEFEGELEPIGFLFPNFLNLKDELFDDAGYDEYDFYDTYSICKFDVIYPVSKTHPEAGAYAPCSFYMYKKKGENIMHLGFLGVDNWIQTLDIEDEESIIPLREAQGMIENIVNELTE